MLGALRRRHRARISIARTMSGPDSSSCAGTAIGRQLLRRRRRFKATVFTPDGSQVICTVERPFYLINVRFPTQCGATAIPAAPSAHLPYVHGTCLACWCCLVHAISTSREETAINQSRKYTCSNVDRLLLALIDMSTPNHLPAHVLAASQADASPGSFLTGPWQILISETTVRPPQSSILIRDGTGALVGEVNQRWHPWRRKYDLYLAKRQFAAIDGPLLAWEFVMRDADGGVLALIDRNFQVRPPLQGPRREFSPGLPAPAASQRQPGVAVLHSSRIGSGVLTDPFDCSRRRFHKGRCGACHRITTSQ